MFINPHVSLNLPGFLLIFLTNNSSKNSLFVQEGEGFGVANVVAISSLVLLLHPVRIRSPERKNTVSFMPISLLALGDSSTEVVQIPTVRKLAMKGLFRPNGKGRAARALLEPICGGTRGSKYQGITFNYYAVRVHRIDEITLISNTEILLFIAVDESCRRNCLQSI